MPAVVISMKAACVDNAILLNYLTSERTLEEPEIGRTGTNILIDITCMDNEQHFRMPGDSGDCEDEGDDRNKRIAIPTTCWRRQPITKLNSIDQYTGTIDGYESDNGDNAEANEEEDLLQVDDRSTQNSKD